MNANTFSPNANCTCNDDCDRTAAIDDEYKPRLFFDGTELFVSVVLSLFCGIVGRITSKQKIRLVQPILGTFLERIRPHDVGGHNLHFDMTKGHATGALPGPIWLDLCVVARCSCVQGHIDSVPPLRVVQQVPPALLTPSLADWQIHRLVSQPIPERISPTPEVMRGVMDSAEQHWAPHDSAFYSLASSRVLAPMRRWERISGTSTSINMAESQVYLAAAEQAYDRLANYHDTALKGAEERHVAEEINKMIAEKDAEHEAMEMDREWSESDRARKEFDTM